MKAKQKRVGIDSGGLVYSTEHGKMCPVCGEAITQCICSLHMPAASRDGIVRVGRETKGRKTAAGVTVITGLPLAAPALADLCTRLKKRCGSGGTVKDGVIEIQGDHRDVVIAELAREGWTVKRVGG